MNRRPLLLSTLVFFDLETTGLPRCGFKPEITELCMLAVSRFALEMQDTPVRVQNKLILCFKPKRNIQCEATKVSVCRPKSLPKDRHYEPDGCEVEVKNVKLFPTSLGKDNLFHQKVFDSNAADLIQSFLKQLDPPVCLVAQNGYKFDYPLLRTELASVCGAACKLLDSTGSPILCSDSLHLFKALLKPFQTSLNDSGLGCSMDSSSSSSQSIPSGPLAQSSPRKPDQEVSWHLGDIYARVFGTSHKYAHNAEGDSLAILELIQHIGFPAFDWLQVNYREFNSFHFMYPPIAYAEIDTNPPKSQTILTDTASQLENIKLH